MNNRIAASVLCAISFAHLIQAQEPPAPSWKAGVAKIVITPREPMWMSGYAARNKPAEGKVHDLWAKALALQDAEGNRCLLITMDLVGIDRELSQDVCKEIKKRHGLPRSAIMLAVSHTHCGPVVRSNLRTMYQLEEAQEKLIDAYALDLKEKLLFLAEEALKDLAPARVERGGGRVTFATNRRNNKEPDVPKLRELGLLKGPVDHELPVLSVRAPDGKLRAVAFGYACHATVLSFFQWCGDYPGFAQLAVEKAHPGAVALFWAGCGADQNPLPRRSVELAQKYGNELAEGVSAVLSAPMTPIEGKLQSSYVEVALPLADLPSRELLVEQSSAKDRYVAARARLLLDQLQKAGSLRQSYPYPVQAWQLGTDLTWVALGGEVVVDYSLRLRKELGPVWVTGYANDVMAYIPSLRVLKEGGYEGATSMVYYAMPTVWAPRIEEMIVDAVKEQVRKVKRGAERPRGACTARLSALVLGLLHARLEFKAIQSPGFTHITYLTSGVRGPGDFDTGGETSLCVVSFGAMQSKNAFPV